MSGAGFERRGDGSPDGPAAAEDSATEAEGATLGEAKWSAVKALERRFPGLEAEEVTFEVLSEGDGDAEGAGGRARVRAEADLERFDDVLARVVVRMIHACGQVDLVDDVEASADVVTSAREALRAGAPILCDAQMVAAGVTRSRLPAHNDVVCTLGDDRVPELARRLGTTRSAAAVDLWADRLGGAVVAIGNAPTALFRLLELLDLGAPPPAAVVGVPVGFVGAVESKQALARRRPGVPYLVVHGRRGGSAITAAAVNALATEQEIIR